MILLVLIAFPAKHLLSKSFMQPVLKIGKPFIRCFICILLVFSCSPMFGRTQAISFDSTPFRATGNDQLDKLPITAVDFKQLSKQLSPESPLVLFVRHGQSEDNASPAFQAILGNLLRTLNGTTSTLSNHETNQFFDTDLTANGIGHSDDLRTQLADSEWGQFMKMNTGKTLYITSPLSRSIRTGLHAFPGKTFIIDEGAREQFFPLGPSFRRSLQSPLTINNQNVESVQVKFQEFSKDLLFQLASPNSARIIERLGYDSGIDAHLSRRTLEIPADFDTRVLNWFEKLRPNPAATPPNKTHIYVVVTHGLFIGRFLERFDLYPVNGSTSLAVRNGVMFPFLVHYD